MSDRNENSLLGVGGFYHHLSCARAQLQLRQGKPGLCKHESAAGFCIQLHKRSPGPDNPPPVKWNLVLQLPGVSLGICGRPPSFVPNIQWGASGHLTRVKETFSGDVFGVPLRPDLSFMLPQILFLVSADELGVYRARPHWSLGGKDREPKP